MPAADIAETLQRALPGVAIESWDAADQPVRRGEQPRGQVGLRQT